jgi:hypothetical protein
MTDQEKQEFENMKQDLEHLKNLYFKGDFHDKKVYYKDIESTSTVASSGEGFRLRHRDNIAGVHMHCGDEINSAGIKAEVGHTCPNGSTYYSSSPTQPFLIMVSTTWVLVALP